jgi:type IV pilus assembly protein PilY1
MKRRYIALLIALIATSASAQNAQNNPVGMIASPPPNVMFHLDDSGSMMFEVTPEELQPNGTEDSTVTTMDNWCTNGCTNWISNTFPKQFNLYGTSDYASGQNVVVSFVNSLPAARYRTASLNLSYYDPNKTYLPWIDGTTGLRMVNATPTAARYSPMKATPTLNLTINQSEAGITWLNDAGTRTTTRSSTFYPALFYTYTPTTCSPKNTSNLACFTRTEIRSTILTYSNNGNRTECPVTCTYAQEIQNFANWFTYARSRVLSAKYAVGVAINGLDASIQVGMDAINNTGTPVAVPVPMTAAAKTTYINNFYAYPIDTNGTPSLAANLKLGNWFANSSDTSACRNNHIIFVTDGYWNDSSNSAGNQDGTSGVAITSSSGSVYTYAPVAPFTDTVSGTLADIAMKFWKTDMKTGVANQVRTSADDPAYWQHINFHGISFGIQGLLERPVILANPTWTSSQVATSILNSMVASATPLWPNPYTSTSPQAKIDDLWHATVNGHGQFFNSADANGLANAVLAIFKTIADKEAAGAASAVSSPNITAANNALYNSQYVTGAWTGEVYRQSINVNTGAIITTKAWTTDTTLVAGTTASSAVVRPTSLVAGSDNRRIYTVNQSTGAIQDFCTTGSGVGCATATGSGLSASEKAYLSAAGLSQYATWTAAQKTAASADVFVNYIRGRTDYEDDAVNPSSANRLLRARAKVMGDVINGSAAFVQNPTFSYDQGSGGAAYATYKAATRQAQLYVPANDGMLHAFNPDTGVENWAFIPPQVWPTLPLLADKNYSLSTGHRFYVDATPAVGDVKDTAADATWKTIAIGSMGNGGKGYYALDITNPMSPQVLWNLCDVAALCNRVDADAGYVSGKAVITRVPIAGVLTWVAIMPSGFTSSAGGSYIYIVNALTGVMIKQIKCLCGLIIGRLKILQ